MIHRNKATLPPPTKRLCVYVHAAACTSITISDFGIYTGTYTEIEATSYDELYYRAGGMDLYYVYLNDGAWYLYPTVAIYPQYRVSSAFEERYTAFPVHVLQVR